MKFFLDTANLDEIREANALGLVDGITTNPTLVAKEGGVDFKQHIAVLWTETYEPHMDGFRFFRTFGARMIAVRYNWRHGHHHAAR